MPPKSQKKSAAQRKAEERAFNERLEAMVNAIEGTQRPKSGATKSQLQKQEETQLAQIQGRGQQITPEQMRQFVLLQQRRREEAILKAQYVNVPVPLSEEQLTWQEVAPGKFIRYEQFRGTDEEMDFIVDLFTKELTEPYSSFTYQHFVFGWPDLCITAFGYEGSSKPDASVVGEKVGAVVSRVTRKAPEMPLRGYVAMFAVVPQFRGFRLGSRLVTLTAELMRAKGCDQLYLETPTANERALSLYLSLGFVKTKFLRRFYLDHSDAYRLVLWLKKSPLTVADENTRAAATKAVADKEATA